MRLLCTFFVLLLVVPFAIAQDRQKKSKDVKLTLEAEYTLERAGYTRELWVGISSMEVNADDLRKALAKACDDTTSVAVITPTTSDGLQEEQDALAAFTGRQALNQLSTDMMLMGTEDANARKHVRIVLVGVLDSCSVVLRIAADTLGIADGVLLIDPPVDDLPEIAADARPVGVDVLLHPRSDAEFAREEATLVERLGPWGKAVRVLRGDSFDDLKQRVADGWGQLRAPRAQLPDVDSWCTPVQLAEKMVGDNDVVFLGELHGNPGAHRAELEFLRYMKSLDRPVALATEQFERDVQSVLDDYLAGKITEADFLKKSRAWPNYADYRPLIEFCKENKIPVIAGNIPRPLASRVNKEGPETVEKFSAEEKKWSAAGLNALPGAYRDRFMEVMGGAAGHSDGLERMYAAQCFKDDTMAESVANWLKSNPKGRVLHINGSFHSAGGLGAPEKLQAMLPDAKLVMVTCVEAGEDAEPAADEWIIRVPASRPQRE